MQRRINICADQRLQIVNPAEQHTTGTDMVGEPGLPLPAFDQQHRSKMRAGGIPRNVNPPRIETQRRGLPMQRSDRPPALRYDESDAGPWRQSVINRSKRNSIRDAIRRCKKRFVLRVLLPVTPVDVNQQRRIRGCRWEIIEYFIRPIAPEQILLAAKARFRIAAARDVFVQERFNRSNAGARRILTLALGERPFSPVRGVVCHVRIDSAIRFRGKQYYKATNPLRDCTCQIYASS